MFSVSLVYCQEVKLAILVWKRLCNIFVLHQDVRGSGLQVFAYFSRFDFLA